MVISRAGGRVLEGLELSKDDMLRFWKYGRRVRQDGLFEVLPVGECGEHRVRLICAHWRLWGVQHGRLEGPHLRGGFDPAG